MKLKYHRYGRNSTSFSKIQLHNQNIIPTFNILPKQLFMANTYYQMYTHVVFAVKYRNAQINPEWKAELISVIGNLINETGCKPIVIDGVEDHIHCLLSVKPSMTLSDVMKSVKAKSSKWINESGKLKHRFEWQTGFGAFSYSKSHVSNIFNYIKNQEEHHKKQTFREEYLEMLKRFEVEYDEKYIFEALV